MYSCDLASGNIPHNPVRFANTVGLVIERVRPKAAIGMCCSMSTQACDIHRSPSLNEDRLRWYCQAPEHERPTVIRETSFHLTDMGTQLKPFIEEWMSNEEGRRCPSCGTIAEAK